MTSECAENPLLKLKPELVVNDPRVLSVISLLKSSLADLEGIYIFGSRAIGEENNQSDWDFAFLSRKDLSEVELFNLQLECEALIGADVDLVDLYKSSTVFQWQMLHTGIRIYEADQFAMDTFEYLAISYYQKLKEERAAILADIKARKSIYGR